jgi:hypothetical protein
VEECAVFCASDPNTKSSSFTKKEPPPVPTQYRRVIKPFLALEAKDGASTFFSTIRVGSILYTDADVWQPGLMTISLLGENLLTFARDLRECTEVLDLPLALSAMASAS